MCIVNCTFYCAHYNISFVEVEYYENSLQVQCILVFCPFAFDYCIFFDFLFLYFFFDATISGE